MPYLETLLVLLLVVGSVFLARGISRLPTPWWGIGFVLPLIVVIAFGVARRFPEYAFIPPFSWLMHGRVQFIGIGMALTILLITPVRHLENERQKRLVWLFMIVIVLYTSISPVLLPAVLREHHENLDYLVDENEICHQPNDNTCGPAAAVTALRTRRPSRERTPISSAGRSSRSFPRKASRAPTATSRASTSCVPWTAFRSRSSSSRFSSTTT